MPVNAIIYQPTVSQLLAAYRPIVFRVEATTTDGDPVPPYVVCDIYIADVYYKSIIRTSAKSATALLSVWEFDISDALQEYLQPDIAQIDNVAVLQARHMSAKVFCRFRSSTINADGFTVEEPTVPVQATRFTAAVSGTGLESNSFYAINATLQHEDNQNLETHLNSYKTGVWKTDAFPLTHRRTYHFCNNDSDHYPVIFTGDCLEADLVLFYKLKGQTSFTQATALDGGSCDSVGFTVGVTGNQVSGTLDSAPTLHFAVAYKKQADSVWLHGGYFYGTTYSFNVNGDDIAGDYDIRIVHFCSACFSGSPAFDVFTLDGEVVNTAWRGINPFCVVQDIDPPVYIVLELRNFLQTEVFFPNNVTPINRRFTTTYDLYAKFYSDAAHLTPVSVTETGMKVYVKKTENTADDTGTGVYAREVETLETFTVNPAGVEVLLDNVDTDRSIDNYGPYPTVTSSSDSNWVFTMYPTHELEGGNTGDTGYADLQEYNTDTNASTGVEKPNDSGDPDYIPPFADPLVCPSGPDQTRVTYGSALEIAKVELLYSATSVYSETRTDTQAGGYQYLFNVPRNTNVSVTVKARALVGGSTSGFIKTRVYYTDSGGVDQMSEFDVASNVETTLPAVFQNVYLINISNF